MTLTSAPASMTVHLVINEFDANQALRMAGFMTKASSHFEQHPHPVRIPELADAYLEAHQETPGAFLLSVAMHWSQAAEEYRLPEAVSRERFHVIDAWPSSQ